MSQPNQSQTNNLVSSTTHRTFETLADRMANQALPGVGRRQRSHSIHDLYENGEVVRRHVHDNARSGGSQFQHVIGGVRANGSRWGRNDPQNW